MNEWQNLTDLSGRLLIAAIFLISGVGKVTGYDGTQGYTEAMSTEVRS